MIKITDAAAEQIKKSLSEDSKQTLPLRFAAQKDKEDNFQYLMGFDDQTKIRDESFHINGIDIVIAIENKPLLDGMSVDFVELEPGKYSFIFNNPNDPSHGKTK